MDFYYIEQEDTSPTKYEVYAVGPIQTDRLREGTLELNQGFIEGTAQSVPSPVLLALNQLLSDWKLDLDTDLPKITLTENTYVDIRNLIQGGDLMVYRVNFTYARKVAHHQVTETKYLDSDNVEQTFTAKAVTPFKVYQGILADGTGTTDVVSATMFDDPITLMKLPAMRLEAALANNVLDVNWADDNMQSEFTLSARITTIEEHFDEYSLDSLADKAETLTFVLTEIVHVLDNDTALTGLERGTTDIIGYQR